MGGSVIGDETRTRMIHRSGLAHRMLSRVGGKRRVFDKLSSAVVDGFAGFYGRSLPMQWADAETIERERRKAAAAILRRQRGPLLPRALVQLS